MDSLKTLHLAIVKVPEQVQLLAKVSNKDLWLNVLEKNGLYPSLNKFEVIVGKQMPEGAAKQQSAARFIEKRNNISHLLALKNKHNLNDVNLQASARGNDKAIGLSINNNVKNGYPSQMANYYQQLNNLFVTNQKGIRLAGLFRNDAMNTYWLSKNITITQTNSSLEVWMRDASLVEDKLTNILRHLRHCMADLGVSLSKVTINGKVAYYANHHSRMEG